MKINILKIEKKLNIKLKNKLLLEKAFTHKSFNKFLNNEKLEFLGDRVIGLVLSEKIYNLYPDENEGVLDKRLAVLVKKSTCRNIAWLLGLQNFIITGNLKKKLSISDDKILSDACEALVGAIYIDQGYDYAKSFVLRVWSEQINKSNITIFDSKTKLQEYSLKKYKKLPSYIFVSSKGFKHNPVFKISVSITGTKKHFGEGKSKQQAEQDGASNLLKVLGLI